MKKIFESTKSLTAAFVSSIGLEEGPAYDASDQKDLYKLPLLTLRMTRVRSRSLISRSMKSDTIISYTDVCAPA